MSEIRSGYEMRRAVAAVVRTNETGAHAMQWAPTGNHLDGQPGLMVRFLATDGTTRGYAGGPGQTLTFGSPAGDLDLHTRQWAVIHADGRITIEDTFEGVVTPLPDGPECRYHFMPGGLDHYYDCTCGGRSAEALAPVFADELV